MLRPAYLRLSRFFAGSLVLALLLASGATSPAQSTDREVESRRAKALAIAKRYAEHEWRGSEALRFHGVDPDGVRVDTPDGKQRGFKGWRADGSKNVGIPYKWGGFTRLQEFDRAIRAGRYAGQLPVGLRASRHAVGVDCSGFVSRCWELPMKQSTRSLGRLCYRLERFEDLEPGDIVNTNDGHVMLFAGFANRSRTKIRVYEATLPKVLSSVHDVKNLERAGFEPLRYKPFDKRWIRIDVKDPTFVAPEDAEREWIPSDPPSDPGSHAAVSAPLAGAEVGDWCAYGVRDSAPGAPMLNLRRSIVKVTDARVFVQSATSIGQESIETLAESDPNAPVVDALIAFRDLREPPKNVKRGETSIEYGEYRIGDRVFPAQRIRTTLDGVLTLRGKRWPFHLVTDVVRSDDVPLEGVLRGEYRATVTIDGRKSRETRTFDLVASRE